ncbi:MAG TPA: dephospho-CoA kinase [Chitinophagaceae bacterium]
MLKVGLTGGIGSGKSTVAKIFEVLGIPVYYADAETKRLMNENEQLKAAIIKNFGSESFKDGKLNRSYIASIVFNNTEKLDLLNSLTHPVTIQHANEWMKQQTTPYVLKEAALIFESGADKELDLVIGVYSPKPLRIKRVMERDGLSSDEVIKRINQQMNEEKKMERCDFVIQNNEQQLLIPQVLSLHDQLLKTNVGITTTKGY